MQGHAATRNFGTSRPATRMLCRALLLSLAENAEAGESPRLGCFGLPGRLPGPRQQLLKLMPFGSPGYDAFKHVSKPGQWFNTIQFCRLHQRCNDCPVTSAVVVSGEERILAGYRYGSDSTLNCVCIQLQAA